MTTNSDFSKSIYVDQKCPPKNFYVIFVISIGFILKKVLSISVNLMKNFYLRAYVGIGLLKSVNIVGVNIIRGLFLTSHW